MVSCKCDIGIPKCYRLSYLGNTHFGSHKTKAKKEKMRSMKCMYKNGKGYCHNKIITNNHATIRCKKNREKKCKQRKIEVLDV